MLDLGDADPVEVALDRVLQAARRHREFQRLLAIVIGIEPEDQAGQLWSMDYDRLIPVLTRAIQEQQEMIEALENKVEALNRKLSQQPQEME